MNSSPYQSALADRYQSLAPLLQSLHEGSPISASGKLRVERGTNFIARVAAVFMRLPLESPATEVTLRVERRGTKEYWRRTFGSRRVDTCQWLARDRLCESSGPFVMSFDLDTTGDSLTMQSVRTYLLGIPLPGWLSPKVFARESAVDNGWIVEVEISLPMVGRMVRYQGTMFLNAAKLAPEPLPA